MAVGFVRINLDAVQCSRLSLSLHLESKRAPEEYVGNYGATYQRGKRPHLISAWMHETSDSGLYHADINYRRADFGKPPKGFRNPDDFWGFLEHVGALSDVVASVNFEYPATEWESLFTLPSALGISEFPLTHIEGYTFGTRVEDELEYTIHISQPGENVLHAVTTRKAAMTFHRDLIPQILDVASTRSRVLVKERALPDD